MGCILFVTLPLLRDDTGGRWRGGGGGCQGVQPLSLLEPHAWFSGLSAYRLKMTFWVEYGAYHTEPRVLRKAGIGVGSFAA